MPFIRGMGGVKDTKHIGSRPWRFTVTWHNGSGHQVNIRFAMCHFLLVVHRGHISNGFRDICILIYLKHDLDLLGHVMSSGTWSYDTQGAISYRCSIVHVTEYVSPLSSRFRDNGPQTCYCWGHDVDLSRSTDVIDNAIIRFARYVLFPIGGPFEQIWFYVLRIINYANVEAYIVKEFDK